MTLPAQTDGGGRMGAAASPLLGRTLFRSLVAAGMVLGSCAAFLAGSVLFVWATAPFAFFGALGVFAVSPFAAWTVDRGRWSKGIPGAVQIAAVALTGASYVAVAVYAGSQALEAFQARSTLAPPPELLGFWVAVAAGAAIAVAVLMAALPLRMSRAATMAAAGALAVAALACAGLAVVVTVQRDRCEDFEFDRARWKAALAHDDAPGETSDAEYMGDAIARCHTVHGATPSEVTALLGRPDTHSHRHGKRRWYWQVGWTNDAIGPGDGRVLWIEFGPGKRVHKAGLH